MRSHFECDFFDMPPCPPHFGPWDRGFGPCGRSRPPFFMGSWTPFDRHGCRPHGPPGFDHSPDRHGPPRHEAQPHGPPPPPPHEGGRHGPPGCGRRGHVGDHFGPPRFRHHGRPDCRRQESPEGHYAHHRCGRSRSPENRHSSPECGRRGAPTHDHECHHGPRDNSPKHGPPRWGHHHHHEFGPGHRGFGPGPFSRDFFDWPGFGPHHHFGSRFGHRRPGPYDRPGSPCRDCDKCRDKPCCSGNKNKRTSNENEAGRKENGPCSAKNKDQNGTENTVLVQRIVVERAPADRPQSV